MKNLNFFLLFALLLFIASCGDDTPTTGCETAFEQQDLFTNLADNLIIPAYTDLKEKIIILKNKNIDFQANKNQTTLEALRTAWFEAYLSWQRAAPFEFGAAATVFLQNSLNNFPTDTAAVTENITTLNYDFDMVDNYDKGFPALDYLLFGIGDDDAEILEKYTTNALAPNYNQYLTALILDMGNRVNTVFDAWTTTYRGEFIANTGSAAGSSLSLIINGLNQNYEYIKRDKIGIPSGVLTLGFTNPTKVEAYFSGQSLPLAKAALETSRDFYLGKNGVGLDDYLRTVGTMKGNETLDAVIQNQFTSALNALDALSNPLSETVNTNNAAVVNAYNELTKQLVYIKTDMPSVLCVAITYIDNPSDSD